MSTPFSEGKKLVAVLLACGWSCPGQDLSVVIPVKGWRSPDGRGVDLIDALKEESLWINPGKVKEVLDSSATRRSQLGL